MLTVLIGPPGAGKSTAGAALAELTARPFVDADEHAASSYARVGWSVSRLQERARQVGFENAHAEWEEALAAAVVDLVARYPNAVLALCAGHSHLTRSGPAEAVALALAGADQVVLLRPHPGTSISLGVLRTRCIDTKGHDWRVEGTDWLHRWLTDGRDELLATGTVYTADRTADATAAEMAALPPLWLNGFRQSAGWNCQWLLNR